MTIDEEVEEEEEEEKESGASGDPVLESTERGIGAKAKLLKCKKYAGSNFRRC